MQSLLILGRQPALGLAELESLYGASKVTPYGYGAAIVDVDPCELAFDRLGGSTKFCRILTTLDTTDWKEIEKFLIKVSPEHSERMPEGKMTIGLSLYGFRETTQRIQATGLSIKKAIRKTGRPVRLVPNKERELNTAQVLHNKLTGTNGWELVFIKNVDKTIVAQTVKIQDIESYTERDRERPKRDARVGMLPPKLAQIITNLAVGELPTESMSSICEIPAGDIIPRPKFSLTILDPFCGTGVLLQEAALMGYKAYGTDLEPRMIDYSLVNLQWLDKKYNLEAGDSRLEVGDATSHKWGKPLDFVACETYLGRPFTSQPPHSILTDTVTECNTIITKFLRNLHGQVKSGTRMCIAVPAWQTRRNHFKFLPLIDQIEDLGYNRMSFEHAGNQDLLYYREDQIVARHLIVLTKR
jgi:tRNA (guanine10-N2)-dimethyltransferase